MKENLKPYVYKQMELKAGAIPERHRTFCRMVRRVIVRSKLKVFSTGGEARASLNRATKLRAIDPKPGDLSMGRLKWR